MRLTKLTKQPNNEKSNWQDAESETGPDEQLKRWNKDKYVKTLAAEKREARSDRRECLAAESA